MKLHDKKSTIFRSYLLRFFFRLFVAFTVFLMYIKNSQSLNFTLSHSIFSIVSALWLILALDFALQLSPRSPVSRGCRKQFAQTFIPSNTPADSSLMRSKLKNLNIGASRVAAVWIAANLFFAWLYFRGTLGVSEMLLLTVFYYLCDVICIVFYCPFQKLFMKNKCCVTCRIFAWGTIMTVTPLIFVRSLYSWSLLALALFCVISWEITYRRHPERFLEETNKFLTCSNCTDHLCVIKHSFESFIAHSKK